MTDPHQPDLRAAWEDRVTERALLELHGDRPPDLADAVLRRLHGGTGGRSAAGRRPTVSPRSILLAALALLSGLLLGALLLGPRSGPPGRTTAVQVAVEVLQGELTVIDAGPPERPREGTGGTGQRLAAGERAVVLLRRGDGLRAAVATRSEFTLAPFGLLETEPGTALEVETMDVSLKNGWVAAGSLTLAVVAGAATWHFLGQPQRAEAGQVLKLETPTPGTSDVAKAAADVQRLEQENQDLKARLSDLENQLARRPVTAPAPAETVTAPVAEPVPVTADKPLVMDPRYAELLKDIDWSTMGKVSGEMADLLVELSKALDSGEEMPLELAVKIGSLNLKLVEQLPKLMAAKLPGAGPNGVFSHPMVAGNMLASMLDNAGQGLNTAQKDAVANLVRSYTAENEGIHSMPAEMELDKLLAEVAMKDRLYGELAQQLTPEQRALMYPEGSTDFDGMNLYRTGIMWQGFAEKTSAATPADYVTNVSQKVVSRLEFDDASAARIRQIMTEVAHAAPAEMWSQTGSTIEHGQGSFLRAGRSTRAAQTQQAWMRRVLREVPMSAEQRKKLQELQRVFVPVPK